MRPADEAPVASIEKAANAYLSSLDEAQRAKAALPYDGNDRTKWAFIPLETRKGMPLMDMTEPQKNAAIQLLRSIVSQPGFEKSRKIMDMENVLRQLEGPNSHQRRNPEKYYFTVYGKPSPTAPWGVSIEGHHLSLNFVLEGGKIVDSTPQFFASNPATLKASYGDRFPQGLQILKAEEQLAFDLVRSFSPDQKKKGIVAEKAPKEIRWADQPQPLVESPQGIAVANMTEPQKKLVRELMNAYCQSMRKEVAEERWSLIEKAGFDKIHFAWSGATDPGIGHYYVVQGPSFLIEFINVQADAAGNVANHIHCVWRDMQGDFHLPIGK